ncbi:hypothetical protein VTL71DRAFT_7907 [Oculimacula yallundae]|uniref:Uncharacterized protein n=1 Tax=Oculimacula yallundae TaxID=86028 RepID=A0ABR4CW38_9HELO
MSSPASKLAPTARLPPSPQPPEKCHYTLNSYICGHRIFISSHSTSTSTSTSLLSTPFTPSSANSSSAAKHNANTPQRITHQHPCPFSIPYFFKSENEGKIRCANMEREPWVRDVKELCERCRPGKSESGAEKGKRVEDNEAVEIDLKRQFDALSIKDQKGGRVSGVDGEGVDEAIDEERIDALLSAGNGDGNGDTKDQLVPAFSIFKIVLGAVVLGSSLPGQAVRGSEIEIGDKAGQEDGVDMSAEGGGKEGESEGEVEMARNARRKQKQKVKQKEKEKKKWIHVDEDPDWEVVESEEKM